MMMAIPQKLADLQAEHLIQQLKERNIEAGYCQNKVEALELALSFIPPGSTVSKGGSKTLAEIGLVDALRSGEYTFLDPSSGSGSEEIKSIAYQSMNADVYFTSVNAISADGQLVAIDGIGNRVSALAFGPRRVVIIIGMNKLAPDIDAAISRAKGIASQSFVAQNCNSYQEVLLAAEKVGNMTLVINGNAMPGRIRVILVADDLGY